MTAGLIEFQSCSPEGAQRDPGGGAYPDYTAFHPGYNGIGLGAAWLLPTRSCHARQQAWRGS